MTKVTVPSAFMRDREVKLDPYGDNPLGEDLYAVASGGYTQAGRSGRIEPEMFASGKSPLPLFTASGLEPEMLRQLPYGVRHAAAAEPDMGQVHAMFERHANDPTATIAHPGLDEAKARWLDWFAAGNRGSTPQHEADADAAAEESIFGYAAKAAVDKAAADAAALQDQEDHQNRTGRYAPPTTPGRAVR